MQRHLEAGCENCERVVTSLRRVVEVSESERESAPADAVLGPVKGLFAVETQVMELVWDSARAPSFVTDDSEAGSRQLRFANSEFELDARVAKQEGGSGSKLEGKLQSRFLIGVEDLEVRLVSNEEVVDSSSTDSDGAFELPLSRADGVELQIALADDRELIATLEEDERPTARPD